MLCVAERPLTAPELIDGIAVELGENPCFNPDGRLEDEEDIHRLCPGLIEVDIGRYGNQTIRIAHFSVQEYLESGRIHHPGIAHFSVRRPEAHADMAYLCLTYLLETPVLLVRREEEEKYPLTRYAATCWVEHYHNGDKDLDRVKHHIIRLFRSTEGEFERWTRYLDQYSSRWTGDHKAVPSPQAVYYASRFGLEPALSALLSGPPVGDGRSSQLALPGILELLNTQGGGHFGNPIQAASYFGHKGVVQLLLEKGADINAQGGHYGTALQAASYRCHQVLVQLLLEKGADVNAQGGFYGTALQAASYRGHQAVVQLLLEKGADHGDALQVASTEGYLAVVQVLLEKGADVNAQRGCYGTALQAASHKGYEAVVQLLLEKGADVNAQGGCYGTALQAASHRGYEAVVQLLLEKGAKR